MAVSDYKLTYTKDWKSAEDFPTYEGREEQVREDMQLLFDEMRDAFNQFLDSLAAGEIPFESSEAVPENNIQAALENVQQQAAAAVAGEIPERSLDGLKLKLKAVSQLELGDAAVGTPQLATGSVDETVLKANAVRASHVKDGELTLEKFASGALDGKADLVSGILTRAQRVWRVLSKSTEESPYTLAVNDAESILTFVNATAFTVTLPTNSSVAIPVGSMFVVACNGSANLTFSPASGVTLRYPPDKTGPMTVEKNGVVVLLWKTANNSWLATELAGLLDAGDVSHIELADDAVEANNIKDGEVVDGKLGVNSVNASNIKVNAVSQTIDNITIPTTGWGFDGPPYTQEVAAPGLVPEDPEDQTTTITWAVNSTDPAVIAAYALIEKKAETDKISVSTSSKITVDVPIIATQNGTTHTPTIEAPHWIPTGLPMKQEVSVTGLLAADTPIIDMIPDEDFDTAEAQIEAYSFIYRMIAGAGKLTCYATEEPQASIPIQIKVVRK